MIFLIHSVDSTLMDNQKASEEPFKSPFNPLKQGLLQNGGNLEIAIFSSQASSIYFQIFSEDGLNEIQKISLTKDKDQLFKGSIPLPDPSLTYSYVVDGVSVTDPFSKSLLLNPNRSAPYESKGRFTFDHTFDWEGITPPQTPYAEMVIYEMHVKGFTQDPSSHTSNSGSYLGLIEKIPHLKSLGINTVELMPIFEFDRSINPRVNPLNGERLVHYWGYVTSNFFCPTRLYTVSNDRLAHIHEFKTLIKELHRANIQVILDVVYNHVSINMQLDQIDKKAYFVLTEEGEHTNYTGCGNTINANSDASMNLIFSSLRYFAEECHIDGFRYDLGGALTRDKDGTILDNPPFFQALSQDPILSKKIHTAEPWDAGGVNLLGKLGGPLISEWNGEYASTVRNFINKRNSSENLFSEALKGSQQLFSESKPYLKQIHYITTHDGFTLADLVSYNSKHNEANGEDNQDGDNDNISNNWGAEGPTDDSFIINTRKQVQKNFLVANLLSRGIPLVLMGDEYGLSHGGNNNTYCHDGPINWFNWDDLEKNKDQCNFLSQLCKLRQERIVYAQNVTTLVEADGVVAVLYDDHTIVAFNISDNTIDISSLANGQWVCAISSMETPSLLLTPNASLVAIRAQ